MSRCALVFVIMKRGKLDSKERRYYRKYSAIVHVCDLLASSINTMLLSFATMQ